MIVRKACVVLLATAGFQQAVASALPRQGLSDSAPALAARHEGHDEEPAVVEVHHGPMDLTEADASHHNHSEAGHAGPAHSHGAPKEHFDPSSIPADPLSYLNVDNSDEGHGFLMSSHIVLMSLSWIGFLPLSLYLRTAKHPLYHFAQLGFVVTTLLGLLASLLYKAQMEDLYPHNSHAPVGWFSIILAGGLVTVDTGKLLSGVLQWWKSGSSLVKLPSAAMGATLNDSPFLTASPRTSSYELVGNDDREVGLSPVQEQDEICDSPDAMDVHEAEAGAEGINARRGHRAEMSMDYVTGNQSRSPSGSSPPLVSPPARSSSRDSMDTLHDNERHVRWTTDGKSTSSKLPAWFKARAQPSSRSRLSTFFKYLHIFFLRSLLPLGYGNVLLGIIVYTGKCRGKYVTGCAAHLIKGSIFLAWGLLSFARYLGAWSELGWAWNAKPKADNWRKHAPSAEFIESFLIFFYGATNTFMERFGAKSGDPFNAHQVEHISIAILFFGAGSLSLLMESQTVRRWLADSVRANQQVMTDDHRTADPPTYSASFNPVPALVAALTGIAMGAHHQEYVYAVKIHQLWGAMLVAFAICRMLTYAFLFLRPPASTLPSRPPTELLGSFFCAVGGFIFMVSTEQVGYAAMSSGWDDVFMINNLCLAFIGLLMSWQAILTAIKGWATIRMSGYRQ